jgi:hypothetical protein
MVSDEERQTLLTKIKELSASVLELHRIAPDTVPPHILLLCQMEEDKVAENGGNDLQRIEDEEKDPETGKPTDGDKLRAQQEYLAELGGLFDALDIRCNEFREKLQRRIQPEGGPRQERQINQFRKRKGTW